MKYKAILRSSYNQSLEEGTVVALKSSTMRKARKETSDYMRDSSEYYCTAKIVKA